MYRYVLGSRGYRLLGQVGHNTFPPKSVTFPFLPNEKFTTFPLKPFPYVYYDIKSWKAVSLFKNTIKY